jgi:hypothetical protein
MRKLNFGMAAIAIVSAGVALGVGVTGAAQQDKSKRPSPPASAECKFADGKGLKIDYSSPRMNGRKIMGELVPYGKVWRLGANEATSLVATAGLTIGGLAVPAGSYTLFAVPEQTKWTLIVSKKTGEWGKTYPGEADDFGRTEMKVSALSAPVENFTIALDSAGPRACTLRAEWESTRVTVAVNEQ